MGTRHLICVFKDGEYKVAQYGQWDGYPEGQGINCLEFLKCKMDRKLFEEKLGMIRFGTEEELHNQWKECGADDSGWVDMKVSDKHEELYPENCRDTGAKILSIIQNTEKFLILDNRLKFAEDSLFCEWAYVIDLDKNTFEVYEGYNHSSLNENERFFNIEKIDTEYYPVKHVVTYNLNDLPTKEEFLKYFEDKYENEEGEE